jgi:hypothetical protein
LLIEALDEPVTATIDPADNRHLPGLAGDLNQLASTVI